VEETILIDVPHPERRLIDVCQQENPQAGPRGTPCSSDKAAESVGSHWRGKGADGSANCCLDCLLVTRWAELRGQIGQDSVHGQALPAQTSITGHAASTPRHRWKRLTTIGPREDSTGRHESNGQWH
jgi:hypothetical protein